MNSWLELETYLLTHHYYAINNGKAKNIVLFGNCHVAPLGYFVNKLFNEEYNIYIIISYFFEKNDLTNFNMIEINKKLQELIYSSSIFIYQLHIKDYGVNASTIQNLVNPSTTVFRIPNLRLLYNTKSKEEYNNSLHILKYNIHNSDFKEYMFLIEHINKYKFFNTNEHPTHFLLFLVAQSIVRKIVNDPIKINFQDYIDSHTRQYYTQFNKYIVLPGKEPITQEIADITGIPINAEVFD